MEILGENDKQQSWGQGQRERLTKQSSTAQVMVGVRFLLSRHPHKIYAIYLTLLEGYCTRVLWVLTRQVTAFQGKVIEKKRFYLPSYMPTRVEGFGFCFSCHKWRHHQRKQVVSSALGFSSFYLTNKASWTWVLGGWKVPIKRRSQRYRTGAGLYRFYHSVPAEAYQLLQRKVQEALQKAIIK